MLGANTDTARRQRRPRWDNETDQVLTRALTLQGQSGRRPSGSWRWRWIMVVEMQNTQSLTGLQGLSWEFCWMTLVSDCCTKSCESSPASRCLWTPSGTANGHGLLLQVQPRCKRPCTATLWSTFLYYCLSLRFPSPALGKRQTTNTIPARPATVLRVRHGSVRAPIRLSCHTKSTGSEVGHQAFACANTAHYDWQPAHLAKCSNFLLQRCARFNPPR